MVDSVRRAPAYRVVAVGLVLAVLLLVALPIVVGKRALPRAAADTPTTTPRVCSGGTWRGVFTATNSHKYAKVWVTSGSTVTVKATFIVTQPGSSTVTLNPWNGVFHFDGPPTTWVYTTSATAGTTGDVTMDLANDYGIDLSYAVKITVSSPGNAPKCSPDVSDTSGPNPSEPHSCCHGDAGDPVDTLTGNLHEDHTDISLATRGPVVDFARSYNSANAATDGPFGHGWTFSYGMNLATNGSGIATITQESGATVSFTPSGSSYVADPWVVATLTHNGDGTWTFVRDARETFTFDSTGRLTKVTDLNGQSTTLSYTGGVLSQIMSSGGHALTVGWTGSHITSVTDSSASPARSVSYVYLNGDLQTVTDVGLGVTTYGYDSASHRLTSVLDPNQANAPSPVPVRTHYDASGRVDSQTDRMGDPPTTFDYTTIDGATTITDPKGNVRVDYYTGGLRTEVTRGYGTAKQASWYFSYDPVSLGVTQVIDPNYQVWNYAYDSSGNQTSATDPIGRTSSSTYNAHNEPLVVTDPVAATTNHYDDAAHPWLLTSVSRPLTGSSPLQTATVTYHHDDPTHPADVTSVTDVRLKTTTYTYDPTTGSVTSATDPLTHKTTWSSFNTLGEPTTMVSGRGNVTGANPTQFTTNYVYDAFGRVTKVTDPLTHYTQTGYDANGNEKNFVDADNHETDFLYNRNDQLIETEPSPPDPTKTTQEGYFPDGTLQWQQNAAGQVTSYTYDPVGRVNGMAEFGTLVGGVPNPGARTTGYGYDPAGNLTTITDPAGNTINRGYNGDGELTSVSYTAPTTPNITNITYDGLGRQKTITQSNNINSAWVYDSLGRVTSSTEGSTTVGYGYTDLSGHATSITYPGGQQVTRHFDDAGRMDWAKDWLNHTTTFGYNEDNQPTTTGFGGTSPSQVDTNGFNNADQLTSITDTGDASSVTMTYARYNSALLQTDTTRVGTTQTVTNYAYDTLGQLTQQNSQPTWAYDPARDLTTSSGTQAGYDGQAQLCESGKNQLANCKVTPTNTTTYTYDNRGDRTSVVPTSGYSTTYGYDQANRLATVNNPAPIFKGAIAAGGQFTLAVTGDGHVLSWGDDAYHEDGDNGTIDHNLPITVPNVSNITSVSAGGYHGLAVDRSGNLWVWGLNSSGQLGNGTTTDVGAPIQLPTSTISQVAQVSGGFAQSLAVTADGSVYAWGYNATGQVGDGTLTNRSTPTKLTGLSGVIAVSAGYADSYALKSDGTVWGWGANDHGQLGQGNTSAYINHPVQVGVGVLSNVKAIAAGGTHALALETDGSVWAWGNNTYMQLGNTDTAHDQLAPVKDTNVTGGDVVAIAAGLYHSVALHSTGRIGVWGINNTGELGNGTHGGTNSATPVDPGVTGVTALADGLAFNIVTNGTAGVTAWGYNTDGQLGTGNTTEADTPTPVKNTAGTGNLTLALTPAVSTYQYAGDNLRTSKTVGTTTTTFGWDQGTTGTASLLTEQTPSATTAYVYGPDGLAYEQVDVGSGTVQYLHHDQQGSTRFLTNLTGTLTGSTSWDAYGNITAAAGTQSHLGYAGQYTDAETGFQYLRNRYYDPATGQFITPDPLRGVTGSPYSYANNSPLNANDPTGLWSFGDLFSSIGNAIASIGCQAAGFISNNRGAFLSVGLVVASIALGPEVDAPLLAGFAEEGGGVIAEDVAAETAANAEPSVGQTIYRVYGGDSAAGGASWTPVDPATVADYRDLAGLPSGNTGQFVIEGTLNDPAAVEQREALSLEETKGGLPEYVIRDWMDNGSVTINRVSGVNPEF